MKALVFDLDDTLFPERDYSLSGFRALGAWFDEVHGTSGFAEAATELFESGYRGRIFDEVLSKLGLQIGPDCVAALVTRFREHVPAIDLHEDARWALRRFRRAAILGILTDGHLIAQRRKVAALGIELLVDHIIYSDYYGRENWKPSPVPYRKVMEVTGCAGSDCIYVGDNPAKDFVTARTLGWRTVQIIREGGQYPGYTRVKSHQAHYRIETLYELDELLPLLGIVPGPSHSLPRY